MSNFLKSNESIPKIYEFSHEQLQSVLKPLYEIRNRLEYKDSNTNNADLWKEINSITSNIHNVMSNQPSKSSINHIANKNVTVQDYNINTVKSQPLQNK